MSEWKSVHNIREFLATSGTTRTGVHNFSKRKVLHWPYCSNCGLMLLKNEVTRRAAKAACRWTDD